MNNLRHLSILETKLFDGLENIRIWLSSDIYEKYFHWGETHRNELYRPKSAKVYTFAI